MRRHPVCACARHTVLSGPRYIPDSLHVPLPSCPLCSHLIFFYPYILPTFGGTRTAASRGPPPEPDDRRQNRRPSPEPDGRRQNRRLSPEQTTVARIDDRPQNRRPPEPDDRRQNRRPSPEQTTVPRIDDRPQN